MAKTSTRRSTPTLRDAVAALEAIAPCHLAAEWDNVGLLAGDLAAACRRALLTIDMTPVVLAEALRVRADLIVAYHPPLFRPIAALRAQSDETDALMWTAVSRGQAVYSLHTALDAAPGGTNDVLAALCELTETQPFDDAAAPGRQSKVVVFVLPSDATRVADAMFAAGAGRIGEYEQCSFAGPGTGTFLGGAGTNPTIGQRGRRESAEELRLETVCPNGRLGDVVAAIRASHSYEEPAFDIYPLTAPAVPGAGMGRVGRLPADMTLQGLARRLKRRLKLGGIEIIGDPARAIATAAVCAGSAGRLPLESRQARDADVVVTGEMSHHNRLRFARRGTGVILLGHCNSERPALASVAKRLDAAVGKLKVQVSAADGPPATWI